MQYIGIHKQLQNIKKPQSNNKIKKEQLTTIQTTMSISKKQNTNNHSWIFWKFKNNTFFFAETLSTCGCLLLIYR